MAEPVALPFETPTNAVSKRMLDDAIRLLGGTDAVRRVVYGVYAVGRIDGHAQEIDSQRDVFDRILKGIQT